MKNITMVKTNFFLYTVVLCAAVFSQVDTNSSTFYLYTYFFNGQDQIGARLALSSDGINFQHYDNVNPILVPLVGSERLMRDPMIYFDHRTRLFHMIWTTGWLGTDIGYASSKDLKTWSEQKAIPVGQEIPNCACCWAPEIYYDDIQESFMIHWATETGTNGKRSYYVLTEDFETFTDAVLFFDPGYSVIDATILKVAEGKYYMFFKDERESMEAGRPAKNIHFVYGPTPQGPWSDVSEAISQVGVEGPSAIKIGNEYRIYFDCYAIPTGTYRMIKVTNIDTTARPWPQGEILKAGTSDFLFSHGNMIEIPREYVMFLLYNRPIPTIGIIHHFSQNNHFDIGRNGATGVFDILGRNIMTIQADDKAAASHYWNMPAGLFLMKNRETKNTQRVLIVK